MDLSEVYQELFIGAGFSDTEAEIGGFKAYSVFENVVFCQQVWTLIYFKIL